jgi:hypothetical protein
MRPFPVDLWNVRLGLHFAQPIQRRVDPIVRGWVSSTAVERRRRAADKYDARGNQHPHAVTRAIYHAASSRSLFTVVMEDLLNRWIPCAVIIPIGAAS